MSNMGGRMKAEREAKHVVILHGIDQLKKSVCALEYFAGVIIEGSKPTAEREGKDALIASPSLREFLGTTPEMLTTLADRIQKTVDELWRQWFRF